MGQAEARATPDIEVYGIEKERGNQREREGSVEIHFEKRESEGWREG